MYNKDIKERYVKFRLDSSTLMEREIIRFFEISRPIEEMFNKDLCNFTNKEIVEFYKFLNVVSLERLQSIHSQYSLYTSWCLNEHLVLDSQNHYLELNVRDLEKLVNKKILHKRIIDRETVLKWAEGLPNARDSFCLLALFEYGKSKDFVDIWNLKISDIHEGYIRLSNRTVKASKTLINLAINAHENDEYYGSNGKVYTLKAGSNIYRDFHNTDEFVDGYQKGRRIYVGMTRCFKFLGVSDWMNINAVVVSGKLNMIERRAKELGMSAVEFVHSPYLKEVKEQYGDNKNAKWYMLKYGDYLEG